MQDGHQVALGHLGVDVVQRGVLGAKLLGDAHVREIEEQDDQALVVILNLVARRHGDGGLGIFGQGALIFEGGRRLGRLGFDGQLLEFEGGDFLRLVVFEQGEVAGFQAFDGLAGLGIFDRDIDDDEVGVAGEFGSGVLDDGHGLLLLARGGEGEEQG